MGQGKSIGEFDIASILNMTVTPVNEAVIDSKKGKGNKTQKTEITIKGGKDIAKVAKESGKQINSVQKAIGKVTKAPVEFVPDTSKVDNAKKKLARPTESKVKLKTEKVNLPLLGKTPVKSSIDKDSRTAIKKTLSAAEETSKNLIDAAKEVVKKIGSANYLEELTKNEQQSVSNAVAKVKRNNPGISEDKLKTFEQNLTLDRRAKKTHDTLSENFRIPSSSSKAYGQEMYEAAIAAAKIQAAVKIREGLHKDEGYTQFLSENDKKKNFNGSTLKLPDKFIDQIQTGLYEHFGVGKLGTALASGKNWTGIQDRMSQSVESFSTGLASAIDATIPKTSTGKPIIKKFQQRIDSAVNTAVGMSVDNAMDYLRGIKGTKESKKALSLLGKKKNGTYEYSIDDIYDILSQKAPTGRNAANKEEAENGVNYKGLSEFLAALQVYKRSGASELNANDVSRLFELANEITTWFNDSNYDAKTVLDSINSALDQAQIEAEKMAKEQPKIEEKPKSKKSNKSSKKSSSTTPQIEEKKIKETAKTEPKKVEKKIEQKQDKQDKADEIKEPKLEKKDEFVSPVPNRSKYKVIKPSNKLKSNSIISYKDGNHYIVSGEKAPDYIYKKFETPSITSKSQESEKDNDTIKEVLLETDGESIKKDKMPKKSKKEKSDNGKLYPTANVPDDFSGLKQLSQRESAAGKKLVKTYQDVDKSIITLTQTYEENEETGASGWKNSVSRYSDFKTLGTEATKITNKILKQKADLDTEMSKPDDKRNQNKIKELKENIKANQANRREIANIARSIANDSSNDYKFSDFVDAVSKGSREQRNALNATKKTNKESIETRTIKNIESEAESLIKDIASLKANIDLQKSKRIVDDEQLNDYQLALIDKENALKKNKEKAQEYANKPDNSYNMDSYNSFVNDKTEEHMENIYWPAKIKASDNSKSGFAKILNGYVDEAVKIISSIMDFKDKLNAEVSKPESERSQSKIDEYSKSFNYYKDKYSKLLQSIKSDERIRDDEESWFTHFYNEQVRDRLKPKQYAIKGRSGKREEDRTVQDQKEASKQVADNYDSILKSTKKIDTYNKSELDLMQKQEKYTAGTDEYDSIAKQIKEVTDARKQEQESIKKIVGNNGVDKWIEDNKSVLDKEKKDISELATARRNVETSERSITDYINQSSISDRYEAAISDIKELQKAQEKLSSIQKEQIENPNKDLSSDIADAVSEYKRLSDTVKDFRENVYDAEKSQKELTDNKQFKEYNSAYDQTTKNVKDNQKSLSQSLKDAYKTQNRYEKKLLTPGTYNNSQNVTDAIEQLEYAKRTASFIEKQMREVHGNEYANKEIARIQSSIQAKAGSSSSIFNNSETMSANIGSISEKLSAYTSSMEKANKATEEFTNRKQGISEKISALKDDYNNGNLSVSDYAKRMQEINNDFSALKEYMTTGAGKNASEYTEVFNKLNKLENSTNKVGQYHEILQGFKSEFQKIKSDYEGDGDLDKYNQSVSNLISRMKDFQKISKNFVATNSKGTLIGESIGKVSDINDATTALENYATKLGYTNKISQSINESTGKVNMTFENTSGNVLKMSGMIEELNENMKGLRVSTNVLSGSGSGGSGSLLGGLKNLVSGNFKSIVGEIGSSVANVQILGQAFQQMKDGFNTFLDFNKGLTNISYTMDMSKEQLSSLGSSAVDMAKDLSMSLDNTMDIYQIYANMNTTSKEIQETAKPTAILSNLSGVDASTAADQVQGILQQFHMLEDGSTTAADASMHVVDVLDKISGNIGMDYAKGIKVISDAVEASGQVAYDAGMSYEQLAAVSAKVAERTREDGSSIGNAMKTIITRISKVGSMPEYAADVSNEDLSQASESLHKVGVEVYNTDGSFRDLDTILSELNAKWDGLTDAQKANISYNVAATRLKASLCMEKFILRMILIAGNALIGQSYLYNILLYKALHHNNQETRL